MREQEDLPSGTIIPAPDPVPVERVRQRCEQLDNVPELACTAAWSLACRSWWRDERDRRLRDHALGVLLLTSEELEAWLARRFDERTLADGHGHVTSQRAGVERNHHRRNLTASTFRRGPLWAEHRSGARTLFAAAEDLPAHLARLASAAEALPAQPLMRAAWMVQVIGSIHPFHDANGGTSRFFASLELARASLPPFLLTVAQRNKSYIDSIMEANRTQTVDPIALVVHDSLQASLASLLLGGAAPRASWDDATRTRVDHWFELAEARCRAAIGAPFEATVVRTESPTTIARIARRGHRMTLEPAPRWTTLQLPAPGPINIDLAVSRVRGGPTSWLVAVIAGSVGEQGRLVELHTTEPVTAMFAAPDTEPDANVEARFRRWLDTRVDQCMRGLSLWM